MLCHHKHAFAEGPFGFLNHAHHPHSLGFSLLFVLDKETKRMQCCERCAKGDVCTVCILWWWNQSLLRSAYVSCSLSSLICPRTILDPKAVAQSGESLLAHVCFSSDWSAAYEGSTYSSALFELQYLQFPSHHTLHHFVTGHKPRLSSWSQNAAVSRYLMKGLCMISYLRTMRMPVRVIIVITRKQKQIADQAYVKGLAGVRAL